MKKALLAALCFIIVGFMLVNGTFALPDLKTVFADLTAILGKLGVPVDGGTVVNVALVSDDRPQNLYPGGGAVSRWSSVENNGTGDVYFRLVYAVQYDAASWDDLTIQFHVGNGFVEAKGKDGFSADGWKDITIGNTPYKMKVFTYTQALPAYTCSTRVSISMDENVTSEALARYRSDFLHTQVLAVETEAFPKEQFNAVGALDQALPLNTLNPF